MSPANRKHRRLLLIQGESPICFEQAKCLSSNTKPSQCLWIGASAPAPHQAVLAKNYRKYLGQEFSLLVFDLHSGLHPDAFAALVGTIHGGGLIIVLAAPFARIPLNQRFLRRLLDQLTDLSATTSAADAYTHTFPSHLSHHETRQWIPTNDQKRAIAAIEHVVFGHRRRPCALIADRGRGKSAALGIAAGKLILAGKTRILVTALNKAALAQVFEHATSVTNSSPLSALEFVAPDALLRHPEPCDLLLIDEAAALPLPILTGLLQRYARIAFATTIHGYEGSGRGFWLKFRKILDQKAPNWQEIRLNQPIRWSADDPIEAQLNRTLLLNAEPEPYPLSAPFDLSLVQFETLAQDTLTRDESTLNAVFSLLISAHYQTKPSDLQHLLDDPKLQIWTAKIGTMVLAVALVGEEGAIEPRLAEQIRQGKRRAPGQLLAQNLAYHSGLVEAATLRHARIRRIAVREDFRRKTIASLLLGHIFQATKDAAFDTLGVSFGATEELLDFWHANEFRLVRIGYRRDAASGEHAFILLKACSDKGSKLVAKLRQFLADQLPALLIEPLSDLEPQRVARALQNLTYPPPSATDWANLAAFAAQEADYLRALPALQRFLLHYLSKSITANQAGVDLLIRKTLQKQTSVQICQEFQLAGQNAIDQKLSLSVAKLLDQTQ